MFFKNEVSIVTASKVVVAKRLKTLPRHFGCKAMLVERRIFGAMNSLSAEYDGGYWEFWELSNGGFFMALEDDKTYDINVNGNGFSGRLDGNSAGIVACMLVFSNLSFGSEMAWIGDYYHLLLDYVYTLPNAKDIRAAID